MSNASSSSLRQRVAYRDGILLDASDFQQDQAYHRNRLAVALSRIHGFGTVAGLRVERFAAGTTRPDLSARTEEELVVRPGIALDRAGHLVEIETDQCLRLDRWFSHQIARPGAVLKPYRAPDGQRFFVADLFLRFNENAQGLRPGFPEPAADASDAIVPSRTNDSFELKLVARDAPTDTTLPKLPVSRFPTTPTTRAALLAAVYNAYEPDLVSTLREYPDDFNDKQAVFLVRVRIRLLDAPSTDLTRHASGAVLIDDADRPLVACSDLLARLLPV